MTMMGSLPRMIKCPSVCLAFTYAAASEIDRRISKMVEDHGLCVFDSGFFFFWFRPSKHEVGEVSVQLLPRLRRWQQA